MTNSQNDTSQCFSGILRRLLCTGSLQTHPSDLIPEPNTTTNFDHPRKDLQIEVKPPAQATPGIVARLMGLDSLPDLNWDPKQRTLDSSLRSRSVNSVDYLPQFDPTQAHHRRVRTSVSFREIPTFLQQQNNAFLVLCFEKVSGSYRMSLSGSKSEMGLEELKQREVEIERNRENSRERKFERKKENQENKKKPNRVCGKCSSKADNEKLPSKSKIVRRQEHETLKGKRAVKPLNHKETATESKFRNKKKSLQAAKKVTLMRDSENSSPVSVLDVQNILSHHETTTVSGDSRGKFSNSRKKSSSNVTNYDKASSKSTQNFIADDHVLRAKRNRDRDDKPKNTGETQYYAELLSETLRLTEEDIEESDWMAEKVINFEDVEEICTYFGEQILDLLFEQVVDELVGCNMNSSAL